MTIIQPIPAENYTLEPEFRREVIESCENIATPQLEQILGVLVDELSCLNAQINELSCLFFEKWSTGD